MFVKLNINYFILFISSGLIISDALHATLKPKAHVASVAAAVSGSDNDEEEVGFFRLLDLDSLGENAESELELAAGGGMGGSSLFPGPGGHGASAANGIAIFETLPDEMWRYIFKLSDWESIRNLFQVSRRMNALVRAQISRIAGIRNALVEISHLALLQGYGLVISELRIQVNSDVDWQRAAVLLRKKSQLRSLVLELKGTAVNQTTLAEINLIFTGLTHLTSLNLNLEDSNIGNDEVVALAEILSQLVKLNDLTLCLSGNRIGAAGTLALSTVISELPKLTRLHLSFNDNTFSGAEYLFGNANVQGWGTVIFSLPKLTSLSLDLASNSIANEWVINLAGTLIQFSELTSLRLNLYDNSIDDEGAAALAKSLNLLRKLTSITLNLGFNPISKTGVKAVSTLLAKLPQLTELSFNLGGKSIGKTGIRALRLLKRELESKGTSCNLEY